MANGEEEKIFTFDVSDAALEMPVRQAAGPRLLGGFALRMSPGALRQLLVKMRLTWVEQKSVSET